MATNKKQSNSRRQYDAEFKKSAVDLVNNGQSVPQVSQSLGIGESLLYKWRAELSTRATEEVSPLQEENERLRKALKQVELERDILKKALSIFRIFSAA